MHRKSSLKIIQEPTMESSTARWSIPGKSISFNGGAEDEQEINVRDFTKQNNKIKGKLNKADLEKTLCIGIGFTKTSNIDKKWTTRKMFLLLLCFHSQCAKST
jgi:hypothetical protein